MSRLASFYWILNQHHLRTWLRHSPVYQVGLIPTSLPGLWGQVIFSCTHMVFWCAPLCQSGEGTAWGFGDTDYIMHFCYILLQVVSASWWTSNLHQSGSLTVNIHILPHLTQSSDKICLLLICVGQRPKIPLVLCSAHPTTWVFLLCIEEFIASRSHRAP